LCCGNACVLGDLGITLLGCRMCGVCLVKIPSIVGSNVMKAYNAEEKRLIVLATKDISPGQELFLTYERSAW